MISEQPKYRVVYGFKADDYIIVNKDELEKLHYAQYRGAFFVGRYGQVETNKIIAIRPDYKETYGAMPEYQLCGEDLDEIQKKHGNISSFIGKAERKVKYLIANKKENLIGTGYELIESGNQHSKETKKLAEKFKI